MPYFLLSDEQIAIIQELLETVRNLPTPSNRVTDDTHQAPEVYIAKPPADGIPALSGVAETGTGTGTADSTPAIGDIPGVAECDVYKIVDGEMIFAGFSKQQVYNISETAIGANEWVQIQRDKFGKWLAVTGGGSTGDEVASSFCGRVRFTLIDAGTGGIGDSIQGQIESRPYGCDLVHGEDASGILILSNPLGLDLEEGLVGFASFQTTLDDPPASVWEIDSLTCPSTP